MLIPRDRVACKVPRKRRFARKRHDRGHIKPQFACPGHAGSTRAERLLIERSGGLSHRGSCHGRITFAVMRAQILAGSD